MDDGTIEGLIADLDVFTTKTKMNNFLQKEMNAIIGAALEEMGIRQIFDTGQSRAIFVEIASVYLGVDILYILQDEFTDIWSNSRRGRGVLNSKAPKVKITRLNGLQMEIEIEDDGVYGQEVGLTGKKYPSDKRPANDYKSGHITTVVEMIDDGNLAKFEQAIQNIEDIVYNKCMFGG